MLAAACPAPAPVPIPVAVYAAVTAKPAGTPANAVRITTAQAVQAIRMNNHSQKRRLLEYWMRATPPGSAFHAVLASGRRCGQVPHGGHVLTGQGKPRSHGTARRAERGAWRQPQPGNRVPHRLRDSRAARLAHCRLRPGPQPAHSGGALGALVPPK